MSSSFKSNINKTGGRKFKSYAKTCRYSTKSAGAKFQKTGEFLVIVESPSKCKSIEGYLGYKYNVIASCGHITSLESLKDIDTKHDFSPTFRVKDDKTAHVELMRSIIQQYPKCNIIIATDDDREGEAIAYAIATTFDLPLETTPRIVFNEITRTAIQNAFANPIHINMSLVMAQQARQILDVLIGFKVSPVLWKYIYHSKNNALSAGRCQTPALMLVYENHIKGSINISHETYDITGYFLPKNLPFKLNVRFATTEEARIFMEASVGFVHTAKIGEKRFTTRASPKPLNTAQLLQHASNVLRFSPKTTMQVAQALYQGGYITYMRTESKTYSKDFIVSAKSYIENTFGDKKYIGDLTGVENCPGVNPHEAVRVTDVFTREISSDDAQMKSLYKLIWKSSVESCMSDATYNAYNITVSAPQDHKYNYIHEEPIFLGWKQLDVGTVKTGNGKRFEADNSTGTLLYMWALPKECKVHYSQITAQVSERHGHSHYSESTLIRSLEEMGIGRPSTYALFVETIQDRGYVTKEDVVGRKSTCVDFRLIDGILEEVIAEKVFGAEKDRLIIQPVGKLCIEFLSEHFADIFDYSYTKRMEEELDAIANSPVTIARNVSDILVQPVRTEYLVCKRAFDDIDRQIKSISKLKKETYEIDEKHTLTFQQFGPCVVRILDNGEKEYIPVKKSLASSLDLDKVRRKEYSLDELLEFNTPFLGKNDSGVPVIIKVGKFGAYIECGDEKKGLNGIHKPLNELSLEDAISILRGDMEPDVESQKGFLRVLNGDMSIRKGRFGHYIFYRTKAMEKPRFFSLKKFDGKYLDCSVDTVIEWTIATYLKE